MTIRHVAALVVVAPIAGLPIATAVCAGWCSSAADEATTECRHQTDLLGVANANAGCERFFAASLFINEDTRLNAQAMGQVSTPAAALTHAPEEAWLALTRAVAADPSRAASSPVLRL